MDPSKSQFSKIEEVKTNQKSLIIKVLARYASDFFSLKELVQNADDAGATNIQILLTSDSNSSESSYSKLVVRNNGRTFGEKDWSRITTIASGNPDSKSVGYFGVGFFSVFALSDRPSIQSGNKRMTFEWGGADLENLFAHSQILEIHEIEGNWTSFSFDLKSNAEACQWKIEDLELFLLKSLMFPQSLVNIDVFEDEKIALNLARKADIPVELPIPTGLLRDSPLKLFHLESVEVLELKLTVSRTFVLEETSESEKIENPNGKKECTVSTTVLVLLRGRLSVNSKQCKNLLSNLQALLLKAPPQKPVISLAFDATEITKTFKGNSNLKLEKDSYVERVFKILSPTLCGKEPSGKVYIGNETQQTTGTGYHFNALLFPTMERTSLDLQTTVVAEWNKELLFCGGLVARAFYHAQCTRIDMASRAHLSIAERDYDAAFPQMEVLHTAALATTVGSRSRPAWDSSVITAVRSEVALLDSSRTASETKGSGKKNTKIVDNKESLTEAEALMILALCGHSFVHSKPQPAVSSCILDGFWQRNNLKAPILKLLTTMGIQPIHEARLVPASLCGIEKYLNCALVPAVIFDRAPHFFAAHIAPTDVSGNGPGRKKSKEAKELFGKSKGIAVNRPVTELTMDHILEVLPRRQLSLAETVDVIRWYLSWVKKSTNRMCFRPFLNSVRIVIWDTDATSEMLARFETHVEGQPDYSTGLPLPLHTLPVAISQFFSSSDLGAWLGLKPLQFMSSTSSSQDQKSSNSSSNPCGWWEYIVQHHISLWQDLDLCTNMLALVASKVQQDRLDAYQISTVISALGKMSCVPSFIKMSTEGSHATKEIPKNSVVLRKPADVYLLNSEAENHFGNLPTFYKIPGIGRQFLLQIGVREIPQAAVILKRFLSSTSSTWEAAVRYLVPQQSSLTDEDWSELKKRLAGFYLPTDELKAIGLPIVPWNGSISTSESNFLLACEVKSFPSIQDLVSLCCGYNRDFAMASFKYLLDHFDDFYKSEDAQSYLTECNLAYIPSSKQGAPTLASELYLEPDLDLSRSYHPFGVKLIWRPFARAWSEHLLRMGARKEPEIGDLLNILKQVSYGGRLPGGNTWIARDAFDYLGRRIRDISEDQMMEISEIEFVPSRLGPLFKPSQIFWSTCKAKFRSLLEYVHSEDFSRNGCIFLHAAGVREGPNPDDLAMAFLKNYKRCKPEMPIFRRDYVGLLVKLQEVIRSVSEELIEELKRVPFLYSEDFALVKSADVYIEDSSDFIDLFDPPKAIFKLKSLYYCLGTSLWSNALERIYYPKGDPRSTFHSKAIQEIIAARRILFTHEVTNGHQVELRACLKNDAEENLNSIVVLEIQGLEMEVKFGEKSVREEVPCAAEILNMEKNWTLLITSATTFSEVGRYLAKFLLTQPTNDHLLSYGHYMEDSLEKLKKMGVKEVILRDMLDTWNPNTSEIYFAACTLQSIVRVFLAVNAKKRKLAKIAEIKRLEKEAAEEASRPLTEKEKEALKKAKLDKEADLRASLFSLAPISHGGDRMLDHRDSQRNQDAVQNEEVSPANEALSKKFENLDGGIRGDLDRSRLGNIFDDLDVEHHEPYENVKVRPDYDAAELEDVSVCSYHEDIEEDMNEQHRATTRRRSRRNIDDESLGDLSYYREFEGALFGETGFEEGYSFNDEGQRGQLDEFVRNGDNNGKSRELWQDPSKIAEKKRMQDQEEEEKRRAADSLPHKSYDEQFPSLLEQHMDGIEDELVSNYSDYEYVQGQVNNGYDAAVNVPVEFAERGQIGESGKNLWVDPTQDQPLAQQQYAENNASLGNFYAPEGFNAANSYSMQMQQENWGWQQQNIPQMGFETASFGLANAPYRHEFEGAQVGIYGHNTSDYRRASASNSRLHDAYPSSMHELDDKFQSNSGAIDAELDKLRNEVVTLREKLSDGYHEELERKNISLEQEISDLRKQLELALTNINYLKKELSNMQSRMNKTEARAKEAEMLKKKLIQAKEERTVLTRQTAEQFQTVREQQVKDAQLIAAENLHAQTLQEAIKAGKSHEKTLNHLSKAIADLKEARQKLAVSEEKRSVYEALSLRNDELLSKSHQYTVKTLFEENRFCKDTIREGLILPNSEDKAEALKLIAMPIVHEEWTGPNRSKFEANLELGMAKNRLPLSDEEMMIIDQVKAVATRVYPASISLFKLQGVLLGDDTTSHWQNYHRIDMAVKLLGERKIPGVSFDSNTRTLRLAEIKTEKIEIDEENSSVKDESGNNWKEVASNITQMLEGTAENSMPTSDVMSAYFKQFHAPLNLGGLKQKECAKRGLFGSQVQYDEFTKSIFLAENNQMLVNRNRELHSSASDQTVPVNSSFIAKPDL